MLKVNALPFMLWQSIFFFLILSCLVEEGM